MAAADGYRRYGGVARSSRAAKRGFRRAASRTACQPISLLLLPLLDPPGPTSQHVRSYTSFPLLPSPAAPRAAQSSACGRRGCKQTGPRTWRISRLSALAMRLVLFSLMLRLGCGGLRHDMWSDEPGSELDWIGGAGVAGRRSGRRRLARCPPDQADAMVAARGVPHSSSTLLQTAKTMRLFRGEAGEVKRRTRLFAN